MEFSEYLSMAGKVVNEVYTSEGLCESLADKFAEQGYVNLPNFFTDDYFEILQRESVRLSKIKVERDFVMPGYNTPRLISVIGGKQILKNSFIFSALYLSAEMKSVLSSIISKQIFNVNHDEEFMVVNYLEKASGTHGWHLDDPQYALVVILRAPAASEGGYLEVVNNWEDFCGKEGFGPVADTNEAIEVCYKQNLVERIFHNTGDCYLLNAGKCLHRVAPISGVTHRVILNMAFDSREQVEYGATADILYGNKEVSS